MSRVFLNYRREDSEGIAGRIFDRLRARFGHDMERLIQGITGKPQATATSSQWRWISDPNHQRTLGFIGAFVAALAAGGWQLYVHFSANSKPASPTSVSVGDGGIAGNVTTPAEQGGVAVTNTGANTTMHMRVTGITLKEHEESLKRREQELRAEFTKTSAAEKDRLSHPGPREVQGRAA
ncbi:MAG: hypothetical protein USCGTAYLOR_02636 [Chromatiales bacterium USCg_Taylor]|nr:MAG: hypothetical protein USCGTAYLOR_02636 [Chromatiales bacterium USCg_Taylor]